MRTSKYPHVHYVDPAVKYQTNEFKLVYMYMYLYMAYRAIFVASNQIRYRHYNPSIRIRSIADRRDITNPKTYANTSIPTGSLSVRTNPKQFAVESSVRVRDEAQNISNYIFICILQHTIYANEFKFAYVNFIARFTQLIMNARCRCS